MARYQETYFNNYLNKSSTIKADSPWELQLKKQQLFAKWQEEEEKKRKREAIENMRLAEKEEKDFLKNQALEQTKEVQKEIEKYNNILKHTLKINDKLDWNTQYKKINYPPFKTTLCEPKIEEYYAKYHVPAKTIFEYILPFLKRKREELENQATQAYNTAIEEYKQKLEEEKKQAYQKEIEEHNKSITDWKNAYETSEKEAVEKYVRVVLENSEYPTSFNKNYDIQYDNKIKTLIISYNLPSPEQVPKVIEYKFVQSSKTIKPIEMKKKEFDSFYENTVFQVTLYNAPHCQDSFLAFLS